MSGNEILKNSSCDVLIVGGGTGGVSAALAACDLGLKVILTEEYDWIGGQLTSQIVPPDEHPWIEMFGCTRRYREFRNRVRQYYRDWLPLNAKSRLDPQLNPGSGWVSRLCFDPRIGWQVLMGMIQAPLSRGNLELKIGFVPHGCEVEGDFVRSVTVIHKITGVKEVITAKFVLDATETGDLLPLSGTEYNLGAESQADYCEAHALPKEKESENVQGFTWCAVFALDEGSNRVIDRPANYEKWRDFKPTNWLGKLFDFTIEHPVTGLKRDLPLFGKTPDQWYTLFTYRQVLDPQKFDLNFVPHPATVVNWPQNDYYLGTIIDVSKEVREARLAESRDLTHCLLYWLQTDAPRHDGGTGYPGLYTRPDLTGTPDGLAQAPYIRESRRIKALFTITEPMVSSLDNPGLTQAPSLPKSVGIGAYRMDLHPAANGGRTLDIGSLPYQIPLGSLLPIRMRNLLPACKNLGVTHITNGCYRLHPTEWNIGESAGLLAAFCLLKKVSPLDVSEVEETWQEFESLLQSQGIETQWPALRNL